MQWKKEDWRMKKCAYIKAVIVVLGALFLAGCSSGSSGSSDSGPLTPTLTDLQFYSFGGVNPDGGYSTDVEIYSESLLEYDGFLFWLNDDTASVEIRTGTYYLNTNSLDMGHLAYVQFIVNEVGPSSYADWAASTLTKAEAEDYYGATYGSYDQIVSGWIDVSNVEDTYTFDWSFTTADGDSITGSYTGDRVISLDPIIDS
jgi:hypothetical protein